MRFPRPLVPPLSPLPAVPLLCCLAVALASLAAPPRAAAQSNGILVATGEAVTTTTVGGVTTYVFKDNNAISFDGTGTSRSGFAQFKDDIGDPYEVDAGNGKVTTRFAVREQDNLFFADVDMTGDNFWAVKGLIVTPYNAAYMPYGRGIYTLRRVGPGLYDITVEGVDQADW